MSKIAFYDTKPYDKIWFMPLAKEYGYKISFFESRLCAATAILANGFDAVCSFVNDEVDEETVNRLWGYGIRVLLLRCAGYDHVDLKACKNRMTVLRVPNYSPEAVAEHAAALLLACNRKIHRAYFRTREFNFSINGLMGMTLRGKTAGIIGTGKIGMMMVGILKGFGMKIIAYDPFCTDMPAVEYVSAEELFCQSDVISLHCPLTKNTKHMINKTSISHMKDGVILINTSRGALVDTAALIDALKENKFSGVGLDVYEEEEGYFFEDRSNEIIADDDLIRLVSYPNVIVTSHQAFFTEEAMKTIAQVTLENYRAFLLGEKPENEVVYQKKEQK